MKNLKLNRAQIAKNDEFYTRKEDIEKEVSNYWNQLEGKKILCNANDGEWSGFKQYFEEQKKHHNFEIKFTKLDKSRINDDGYLEGDFRSKEQKTLWEWADVIITNPPFSLFREFVDMIIKHKKQFLIIGSLNAISYRNVFKYFQQGLIKTGVNQVKNFLTPNGEMRKFGNIIWWTNLDVGNFKKEIKFCNWDNEKFLKYDNYEAYETIWLYGIKKMGRAQIPLTKKVLGVPLSFITRYNEKQFKILGLYGGGKCKIKENRTFCRLFIKIQDEYYEELITKKKGGK